MPGWLALAALESSAGVEPDQMARREVRELLKESPGLVCVYAANKLRHFASYDPELRAALAGSQRS